MPSPLGSLALRRLTFGAAILLAFALLTQVLTLINRQRQLGETALKVGSEEAQRAAAAIDARLRTLMPAVQAIAADLNSGKLEPQDIPARVRKELDGVPSAFRMGVLYSPYALDGKTKLYGPYVVREAAGLRNYMMDAQIDYSITDWYRKGMAAEGWDDPHFSQTTHQLTAGYHVHFKRPGSTQAGPDGQVRIDLSMDGIRKIISTLSLGRTGYGFLNSPKGTYLAHPREDLVSQQKNLAEEAEGLDEAARKELAALALGGRRGHVETVSSLANLPVMVFIEPIPTSHWTLGAALFKTELAPSPIRVRRDIVNLACTLMALLAVGGLLHFRVLTGEAAQLWKWKVLISTLFAGGIGLLWSLTLVLPDPPADTAIPMVDRDSLNKYFRTKGFVTSGFKKVEVTRVPTGLHLETLRFGGSNDVVATGHVWQKYDTKTQAHLSPGFSFPDAESADLKEVFRRKDGDTEVVEWTFKATLRQRFETNHKYPFDQAVIRFRLWPKDFDTNEVLVPDLEAYQLLNPAALPGIDKDLVIPGWTQKRSYFGFIEKSYSTNFGIAAFAGQEQAPELCFQFILGRKFLDPFISTMLPVLVVACLLFTLLMAGTKIKEKVAATGFKATDILRAAATLLFPVVYAQINLRSRLAASGLIYLEYFYFVMYAIILLVAVNALAFSLGEDGLLHRRDNALPKLLYWPVVLGTFFGISMAFLY